MSLKSTALDAVNQALRIVNVQIIKGRTTDPGVKDYISARKTVSEARKAGLTVGDYLDRKFATPGTTARTVEAMIRLSGLSSAPTVCEIGPGTGRYAEKVIAALQPAVYEVYEPATDWIPRLSKLPSVVVRACDGHTLTPTGTESVDLVHANKVFVYLPFDTVVGYLTEMIRVARPGGAIAFDVVTEKCLEDDIVTLWSTSGTIYRPVPRDWLIDYLERHGAQFAGSDLVRMADGQTELLVFRKSND